ncbi:hypothetical protein HispidOSU_015466 [Sigmodon hispidus]
MAHDSGQGRQGRQKPIPEAMAGLQLSAYKFLRLMSFKPRAKWKGVWQLNEALVTGVAGQLGLTGCSHATLNLHMFSLDLATQRRNLSLISFLWTEACQGSSRDSQAAAESCHLEEQRSLARKGSRKRMSCENDQVPGM